VTEGERMKESEITIDSEKRSNGSGSRLHMKWKYVPCKCMYNE